jgi:hypothetical protein
VAPPEADQLAVTSRIGGNGQTLKHSAGRADLRRGVGVLMSVDADNDVKISMEGQHPVHSFVERHRSRPERRCGKTVMSHTRRRTSF